MDNIAIINGQPAMAYQHETPWHKLGTSVVSLPTVEDALAAAHLDWTVRLEHLYFNDNEGAPVVVPQRLATVRDLDNVVLGTVGTGYSVLQNADAFGVLREACIEHGVTIETAGALGRGERCWMLAKLPEVIRPVDGDEVCGYFLVLTGHDGATPYLAKLTPVRVVCQNTLELALGSHRDLVRLPHLVNMVGGDRLSVVAELVNSLTATFHTAQRQFAHLAAHRFTDTEVGEYLNEVLDIEPDMPVRPILARRRDSILRLVKGGLGVELAPGTAWAAYNAVTEYVDHVRPTEVKNDRAAQRANESALFGANAVLKARALTVARRMAA